MTVNDVCDWRGRWSAMIDCKSLLSSVESHRVVLCTMLLFAYRYIWPFGVNVAAMCCLNRNIDEIYAQHSHDDVPETGSTMSSIPCWLSLSPPNIVDIETEVIARMLYGEDTGVSFICSLAYYSWFYTVWHSIEKESSWKCCVWSFSSLCLGRCIGCYIDSAESPWPYTLFYRPSSA